MKKCFVVASLILLAVALHAQDSLRSMQLEEVIVTGQYEPQSVSKSVYNVRIISAERIKAKAATNLQDLLNTELNFRFSQDLALGTSSVTMNGLPGQYVKVLIDGVPMVGKGSGNDINLNQINVNTIERIEIVDGPMSVAYGADAMAGVINIITKKVYKNRLSVGVRLHEETMGKEYGASQGIHNQYASVGYSLKKFYSKVEAGRNYSGGWKGNATGREKQWHPKTQWLGSGMVGFKNDHANVYYRLDALNEVIYNPGEFQGNQALDQNYIVNRFMHQLQGETDLGNKLSYNGAIAYTDFSRKTQSVNVDKTTGRETLSLGDGQQDRTAFTGLTARGTFQWKVSPQFSIQPGYDVNIESGEGGRLKAGVHTIEDYAFFLSTEYSPNKFISIRPGIRAIHNSQYDAPPLITSLNTKFNLSKRVDFRVSYGRGFRSPSLRELYFNFFDANHSIEGNPDLQPEYSHSFNASINWLMIEQAGFSLKNTLSGFYNNVDNMIASGYKPGNDVVTTYINIAHYKTQGLSLTNTVRYNQLSLTSGFAYTGRYNDFEEEDQSLPEFVWSPEVNASASYVFEKIGVTANFYYKYTGKLFYYEVANINSEQVIRQAYISSINWTDASLQKRLFKFLDLNIGARNLFNVTGVQNTTANTGSAHSSGAVTPIGYGRSFFATLNFQLTK